MLISQNGVSNVFYFTANTFASPGITGVLSLRAELGRFGASFGSASFRGIAFNFKLDCPDHFSSLAKTSNAVQIISQAMARYTKSLPEECFHTRWFGCGLSFGFTWSDAATAIAGGTQGFNFFTVNRAGLW